MTDVGSLGLRAFVYSFVKSLLLHDPVLHCPLLSLTLYLKGQGVLYSLVVLFTLLLIQGLIVGQVSLNICELLI